MSDRLLTLLETAGVLRTPPDTLYYWRHIGTGPQSAKLGRRIVYREADVLARVEQQFAAQSGWTAGRVTNGRAEVDRPRAARKVDIDV